jgi:hypothetical protein
MAFRPNGEPRAGGIPTSPDGGQVEYRLARNSVIREFHKGRLSRLDVCDAHPELLRAGRNLGRPTGDECPICEQHELVEVTFVFGAKLPPGGICVTSQKELRSYWRREDPVVCYAIEVCVDCSWNHLIRMYPGRSATRKPASGRSPARTGRS